MPVFAISTRLVGSAASTVTQPIGCRRWRHATNKNAALSNVMASAAPAPPTTLNRVVASTSSGNATIAAASAWNTAFETCLRRPARSLMNSQTSAYANASAMPTAGGSSPASVIARRKNPPARTRNSRPISVNTTIGS